MDDCPAMTMIDSTAATGRQPAVGSPLQRDVRPLRDRLKGGRVECPACKRKGVGYAAHEHALGWKDYERASCRYCHKVFKLVARDGAEAAA